MPLERPLLSPNCEGTAILRISTIEARNERHLVLEGKLITPWTHELRSACERARVDLGNRELVVDLKNVTVISPEGEDMLSALMSEGVKFRCGGVFARQVLRQVARKVRARL
jgi:anti-anti-sigma regulatory factor